VLGLKDPEFELAVADLIPAEVLRVDRLRCSQDRE
jgi:hypothetical protein